MGHGVNRHVLSYDVRRCQPDGVVERISPEAQAASHAAATLTCERPSARERREERCRSARPTRRREGVIPREGKASTRRAPAQRVGGATGRVRMTTGIGLRSRVRGNRARGVLKQR